MLETLGNGVHKTLDVMHAMCVHDMFEWTVHKRRLLENRQPITNLQDP